MHPAFATIQFGPFQTAYHKSAVDEVFREALSAFLERELLPQIEETYQRTQGHLTAEFNEEKYGGPNSAIRDAYRLEFSFIGEHGADEIKAQIYRDPKTGSFRPRYKGRPLVLWTAKRKAEEHAFRGAIEHLVQRILAGEIRECTCPRCSACLSLVDSPGLFDLSCPQRCFNYNFHRDPKTREFMHGHFFSRPPKPPVGDAGPTTPSNGGPAMASGDAGVSEVPPSARSPLGVMDPRIVRMAQVLGIPLHGPRWAKGDAWYEDPTAFRMLSRIYAVMEYVEAEFGIRGQTERELLHRFLQGLHSAFCYHLKRGEKLEAIKFPPEVLRDYESDFDGRFPSSVMVEKLRSQFEHH
jgi:hypothetical protein